MSYIFISHSKKNIDYVHHLVNYLAIHGFEVWFDESDIEPGSRWWDAIVHSITNCAAFLLVMSPESKESKWVMREVFLADNLNKQFFLLLLDGNVWELFIADQIIDVKNGILPNDRFLKALSQYSNVSSSGAKKPIKIPSDSVKVQVEELVQYNHSNSVVRLNGLFDQKAYADAVEEIGFIAIANKSELPEAVALYEEQLYRIILEKRNPQKTSYTNTSKVYQSAVMIFGEFASGKTTLVEALNLLPQLREGKLKIFDTLSLEESHAQDIITLHYDVQVSVLLWVSNCTRPLGEQELNYLAHLVNLQETIIIVLSKIDTVSYNDLDAIKSHCEARLKHKLGRSIPIYLVSARRALKDNFGESGIPELANAILQAINF